MSKKYDTPCLVIIDICSSWPQFLCEQATHGHDNFENLPEDLRKRKALIRTVLVVLIPAGTQSCEEGGDAFVVCETKAKSTTNPGVRHQVNNVSHPTVNH